jgi:predicted dehydrogenase
LLLDNFRELRGVGFRGFRVQRTLLQDKGHAAQFEAYVRHIKAGGPPLIAFSDLVNVTVASFAAVQSAREERVVDVNQLAAAYLGDRRS